MFYGCNNLINVDCINITKDNYKGIKLIISNINATNNRKINILFVRSSGERINVIVPENIIIADLLFNFYLRNGYNDKLIFLYNGMEVSQNLDKEMYNGESITIID